MTHKVQLHRCSFYRALYFDVGVKFEEDTFIIHSILENTVNLGMVSVEKATKTTTIN